MDEPIVPSMRRCTKCGRDFPATTEFFHIAYGTTLRGDCRECRNALTRSKWVNDDRHKQRKREWYAKHPDRSAVYSRRYHESPKGEAAYRRLYNRERNRVNMATWRSVNPAKNRAAGQRRRAALVGDLAGNDIDAQLKRQKNRCYYCDAPLDKQYHVDHIVPVSRGGLNTPDNIVIACPPCNLSKGDKLLHEWKRGGRLL